MKRIVGLILGISGALAGCQSDPPTSPSVAVAVRVIREPVDSVGNGQRMAPGPKAQLFDGAGKPVAQRGITVSLALATGSGTLTGTTTQRTDDEGIASFDSLVVTGSPGSLAIRFSAPGIAGAVSQPFKLGPGAPASLEVATGSNQVAAAGTDVAVVPTIRVVDQSGNGIPGIIVQTTVEGGGSTAGPSITTDGMGAASLSRWTLGTVPGVNRLRMAVPSGPTATLQALGVVGPPAKLTVVSGNTQTAVAGQPVPIAPVVRVTDAFDNPIEGVTITFSVTAGGGLIAGAQPKSDSAGLAKPASWTLGPDAGPNVLQAVRAGIPTASITATATPVPVSILSGDKQLGFANAGLRIPVQVKVANGFGVARAGVTVSFSALGSGAFSPATAITDSLGRAASAWTVGALPGPQQAQVTAIGFAPAAVQAEVVAFKLIVAGRFHACGLDTAGLAYCWGDNRLAQLGDSTFTDRSTPTRVKTGLVFDTLVAAPNGHFTCGRVASGPTYCWGSNRHGQGGDGTNLGVGGPFGNARPFPVEVGGGLQFKQLTGGGDHMCGLVADGTAYCWGRNNNAEVGNGGTTDVFQPTAVTGGLKFKTIAAGESHTCALTDSGAAYCWGNSLNFRLGVAPNPTTDLTTPTAVQGGGTYIGISAGTLSTCATTAGQVTNCWGGNGSGQLGDGTTTSRGAPSPVVGSPAFAVVSAMGSTACGVRTDGALLCWGEHNGGEAGIGPQGDVLTPTTVPGPRRYSMVSMGAVTSCALELGTGAVYCWGPNSDGQVGDGTLILRSEPTLVRF